MQHVLLVNEGLARVVRCAYRAACDSSGITLLSRSSGNGLHRNGGGTRPESATDTSSSDPASLQRLQGVDFAHRRGEVQDTFLAAGVRQRVRGRGSTRLSQRSGSKRMAEIARTSPRDPAARAQRPIATVPTTLPGCTVRGHVGIQRLASRRPSSQARECKIMWHQL
ncbi:hypothetical protein BV20DRAFT_974104 [Pilatotrama ljubarskyi]|nr:hypothetical protein BV20DRAFT_974104 [Pilatotrama ljubarskyi]